MAISATIQKTMTLGGINFAQSSAPSADAVIVQNVNVPGAEEGFLSTRTGAETGVVGIDDSSHSFLQDERVDVYWVGGCRRGMEITNVTGAAVSIDGGAGDNLPSQGATLFLVTPTFFRITLDGNKIAAILLAAATRAQFVFVDEDGLELFAQQIINGAWDWTTGNGTDNPLAGEEVDGVLVSHGLSTPAVLKVGILYNN